MKRIVVLLLTLLAISFAQAAGKAEELLKGERALTVAQLTKLKALNADLAKAGMKKDEDEGKSDGKDDDLTPEQIVKKLDSDPRIKAILARNGITSMEYATIVVSMFPAAMYLMFEQQMDKKGAADLLASYPKERQANVALLRKNMHLISQ